MAARLLAHEVADLCLGKQPLKSLSISATVRQALIILKSTDDTHISIWNCDHHHSISDQTFIDDCRCVGKICMVDVICYLCKEDNIKSPSSALDSPVSVLISGVPAVVRHVEPAASLVEAIDLIINGAQNLVVPIKSRTTINAKRKQLQRELSIAPTTHAGGYEFCWLTQEDVIRFLLSSIALFSPTAAYSVESLGIISSDILTVNYHSPASTALGAIKTSLADQTSVAVVDDDGILIGEISPFTLAYSDETAAAAIATLSAGDLMAYIDCGGPPEDIIRVVEARLKERNLKGMLEEFSAYSSGIPLINGNSSFSSDEESPPSPATMKSGRFNRSSSYSARITRRAEAIVCYPGSSLVAVMIQAIAHRVSYVWVIEEDCSVVGIVRFSGMLEVFRSHLESMMN
ncbi:CBS domain-containing protein CBSX5-like [Cynara cardunculus var. scolymus]|uniref:Cystathionine beta-synthase, core n=1 Tax=Cynara cardunculus var. scolymus TaxID=59895 RepID=A0A103XY64_CYNCS|nr:CBS domain-containing protein CBSX5-like [Cynara cardunculus var. scolymus]KVH99108.1 Cystathionine beta-synthase, core [Cynara cardunculus var. scolymus]